MPVDRRRTTLGARSRCRRRSTRCEAAFAAAERPDAPLRSHVETDGGNAAADARRTGAQGVGVKLVTLTPANAERGLPFIQRHLRPVRRRDAGAGGHARRRGAHGPADGRRERASRRGILRARRRPPAGPLRRRGAGALAPRGDAGRPARRGARRRVRVSRPRAEGLAASGRPSMGIRASVGGAGGERDADIVCTCTTSTTPVLAGANLPDGVHVNAVGAYTTSMRELDAEAVARAKVVVETREAAAAEAGDLALAASEGAIGAGHVVADLARARAPAPRVRTSPSDITRLQVGRDRLRGPRRRASGRGPTGGGLSRPPDVVVVGGGVVGASAAYHLAAAGAGRVLLLERCGPAGGRLHRRVRRRVPPAVLERGQHPAVAGERADDHRVQRGARAPARRRAGRLPVPRPRPRRCGRTSSRPTRSSARSGSTPSSSRPRRRPRSLPASSSRGSSARRSAPRTGSPTRRV